MANNKSGHWHRGNGSDYPEWFKAHLKRLDGVIEELKAMNRELKEETRELKVDMGLFRVTLKVVCDIADRHDIDITELKKKLKMI